MPLIGASNKVNPNKNELGYDAWGKNKSVLDFSIFHGVWTHFVPAQKWLEYFNGVERNFTSFTSVLGELVCASSGGVSTLESRRFPKYQANRGALYSSSVFINNATPSNGTLYACKIYNGVEHKEAITLPDGFNPSKGNIYDIQVQWRGVGDYKFFINLELVHSFNFLGTLDHLSTIDPSVPVSQTVTNTGIAKFGAYSTTDGFYFKWEFNTPQETTIRLGCVDLTTEGGKDEIREYASVATSTLSGSIPIDGYNFPIIAIRVPELLNGRRNTIDGILTRVTGFCDAKAVLRIWGTRGSIGILTGAWTPYGQGNFEYSENVTVNTALMRLLHSRRIPIDATEEVGISDPSVNFIFTHGDLILVTIHKETGAAANAGVTIEIGMEV